MGYFDVFVNCSNHPSSNWSPEQMQAARDLADVVIDVPFPAVDPHESAEGIENLARKVSSEIYDAAELVAAAHGEDRPEIHLMVQGEMGLTHAIVCVSKFRNWTSYHATSERITEETPQPDGTTKKVSAFKFCKFRRYIL